MTVFNFTHLCIVCILVCGCLYVIRCCNLCIVCVCLLSVVIVIVIEWWSVEGQDTGSGGSKNGDHRRHTAIRVYCTAADNFQHTQNRTNDLFVF